MKRDVPNTTPIADGETIISIEEVSNPDGYAYYEGYRIETTRQEILLLIASEQNCCENWGYATSQDDIASFVGARLIDYCIVDDKLGTYDMPEMYEGGVMFLNLNTTAGVLQFTVYNEHNGYYSHQAKLVCSNKTIEERYL